MRARALTAAAAVAALLVLVAAFARPAPAQTPAPTASPTATPAQATPTATPFPADSARGKAVQRVYDDYRRDGVIEPCRHTQRALQDTLDTIPASFDQDYPDFRESLEAGIQRHKRGRCTAGSGSGSATATPTVTATATVTAAPGSTATALPSATASSTPESGLLPGGGSGSGSGSADGGDGTQGGAAPGATATATPSASPVATPPPAASPVTQTVVEPASNATPLTLPRVLLAIALIGGALLGLWALLCARGGRLAGMRHAWREAGLRTRATWSDFADWLRLGR